MKRIKHLLKNKGRLISIVCIQEKGFTLNYYFDKKGKITKLSFKIPKNKPIIESIVGIYPNADYYEREVHDFYGVEFKGNKKLHLKLFLPDDYKGKPPMVK
ncbi:NADH-quinone oxidoreductase subunit C [Candidatus Woesearchaeota archaeon]|nr:NADH-quinone oxidoreductase subunit C [Candidatus Woesearchaeota archaeon]